MRDAKEIWHFPDPANDVVVISSRLVRRNTLRRLARFTGSVPNFVCNAAQSFGKKWEKVCVSGFTWNEGHQTQNKKRKSYYEKSKHSVQTNSRGSDPAAPRLLCGSVDLGTQSRVSPRRGAVQWHHCGV